MARPRKQTTEQAASAIAATQSAAQSTGIIYTGESVFAPTVGPQGCYTIYAPTDIELRRGRLVVPLEIELSGVGGIITDTPDNARYGIWVHNGQRMVKSHIIPFVATGKMEAVFNIDEETLYTEKTELGTRTRNVFIPAGTAIAKLAIIKA